MRECLKFLRDCFICYFLIMLTIVVILALIGLVWWPLNAVLLIMVGLWFSNGPLPVLFILFGFPFICFIIFYLVIGRN